VFPAVDRGDQTSINLNYKQLAKAQNAQLSAFFVAYCYPIVEKDFL
jgi:hypothetical protein